MSPFALRDEACRDQTAREGTAAFVLSLRARGVFDRNVLRAMEMVPRELFAPRRYTDLARSDVALPLPCGQTMTAPAAVAAMLAALGVEAGHRVLEIGTGSGYVSALLARIGAHVHSIERRQILAESAWTRLAAAGLADRVRVETGDGLAIETECRYDRILLNGVVPHIGAALSSRLAAGGRLVAALPSATLPRLMILSRAEDGSLVHVMGAPVRLSPLAAPPAS